MSTEAEFKWHHIRERLPAFDVPVLVDAHEKSKRLPVVAWRRDCGAGGWEWDNGQNECESYLKKLRYWAHIPDLPERLNFLEERRLGPPHDENDDEPLDDSAEGVRPSQASPKGESNG